MKRWQRRTLGLLDIGGSSLGITVALMQAWQTESTLGLLLVGIALAMYVCGMACGVALFEHHPRAERANFWFWLVQVPIISSPLISYMFTAGAFALVRVNFWPFGYSANAMLGSQFNFTLGTQVPWGIGVNAVALFICWWLWRRQAALRT